LIASVISLKYFAYEVDMNGKEGVEIGEKYKVIQFPTTLFLDDNGKVLEKLKGFYSPKFFIKIVEINNRKRIKIFVKAEEFRKR
jgi:thioredoxin-related protein